MSSSFFLKTVKKTKKRKLQIPTNETTTKAKGKKFNKKPTTSGGGATAPPKKRAHQKNDEEISSDDDLITDGAAPNLQFLSDAEEEEETPQDKRLRLAKRYLEEIELQELEKKEEQELRQNVTQRLHTEYLDSVGRLRRNIAKNFEGYDAENIITLHHKKQHLPICSLALTSNGEYLFVGAKTQFVIKWCLKTMKIVGFFDVSAHKEEAVQKIEKHRRSHVIAICLTSDMKFLALSDGGINIQIWCPDELKHLKTFKGHRDVVTALAFRRDTHELYSGSRDRSIKIWSLDEMSYIESLFGHQTGITSIDALSRERAISTGGSDCTVRLWKIPEESQLIFNAPQTNNSLESVKYINDENFITAGTDGALCVWSALKKKPLHVQPLAHGKQTTNDEPNWITALACVVNTNLLASGSCDGFIRLWELVHNGRKLQLLQKIPMTGFINGLVFNSEGTRLYAAVGQEHRLGRWWRNKNAKNVVKIIELNMKKTNDNATTATTATTTKIAVVAK